MKHLILPVAFTVLCCTAFAQTKKADSTKKVTPAKTPQPPPQLTQQKIWPVNNVPAKKKDSITYKQVPAVKTRVRL